MIGEIDVKTSQLLDELQADSRLSFNALARRLGLSTPAVSERVRKLVESGCIRRFGAVLDRPLAGWPVTAFLRLQCATDRYRAVRSMAEAMPEILECHHTAGEDGFFLKIAARDLQHLEATVERCRQLGETTTSVVLSTYVEDKPLPISRQA
ncbi:MAG: Lrp/AsnC family transcriptional regulator [Alphaproteobacteria bacterium]